LQESDCPITFSAMYRMDAGAAR